MMGQEAGKPAWPKPPGGHQTITGRRYGRRHAYVSFRPTSAKHRNPASVEDWPDTEMDGVHRAHSISSKGNISSMLHAIFPVSSNSVHPEVKIKSGKDPPHKKQSTSRQSSEAHSIHYKKSDQPVAPDQDQNVVSKKSAEASAWPIPEDEDSNPSNSSILSIVNIDAYEPDSSGGEEEGGQGSDTSHGLQKRLDDMIFELGKEFDYLSGLHSYLYTQSSEGTTDCSLRDTESVKDSRTDPRSDSNTEEIPPEWNISEHNRTDHPEISTEFRTPEELATVGPKGPAELGNDDHRGTQSEMVVRPKIRKQSSETHLEKWKSSHGEEAHCGSAKQASKTKCVSAPPFFLTQTERPNQEFLFDYPQTHSYGLSTIERRAEYGEACSKIISDDEKDIWEELEDFNETGVPFMKAEESSECSEGEWSALWTSDSGLEKERGSSQESWVTLPGLDELHNSSLEEVPELSLPPEEPTPLEEGEIPWLMYNEETGSSSDEDPDGMSHFVHPGLFILDGNNNLEDDSSLSEDLDAEWRLLDDFGEGFGMAQDISYVDPQLLTYMALEERLAQAMEAALAHLESLAIDVEQAHPPATEQIIERLPQITILEDPTGQEHCCAICCGEYVKDEIATQLPCHHMFHKICVTLWLQKSGTCPVCRHILSPVVTETTANTSFVSDQDIPPSNHSAAGMR
ncbi:E3 ubiquitin-protein ligase Praja-2-like isoform X1 [Salvelinus fontinalis]|uniref:E3 ubiquitin-protein ligase Praja-2-like isoform X1 n=2 Tax=Salvelinus fontinalis TaxID=8038 RepID=UPI00248508DE|nr:E3 ubiquitin-protein ligase Praja-2-like isoform X1 [Salvelinus fontinalis]